MGKALKGLVSRWWIIVAFVLLGAVAGAVIAATAPKEYAASATLFVNTTGGTTSTESYQGDQFSQQRTDSYAHILGSALIGERVVQALGLPLTGAELAAKVDAATIPRTVLIGVEVTDSSAERAATIANSLCEQFIGYVTPLETPPGQQEARVEVTLVDQAQVPDAQASPTLVAGIAYGALIGLALGLLAVVVAYLTDSRIRDVATLAAVGDVPTLGPVRVPKRSPESLVAQLHSWVTADAEKFRKVRVSLQLVDSPEHVVVVTGTSSATPSAVALDLAAAFAETDEPTILIDADPSNPISAALGIGPEPGLVDVCEGAMSIGDAPVGTANPYLHLLAAGQGEGLSALLSGNAMREALADLRSRYRYVVIGTPAVSRSSAATVLAHSATVTVVAVDRKSARRKHVRRAVTELREAGGQRLRTLFVE